MNGQFIGTANTNELEELQDDSGNVQQNNMQDLNVLNENSDQGLNSLHGGQRQEEIMLEDDDNMPLPSRDMN